MNASLGLTSSRTFAGWRCIRRSRRRRLHDRPHRPARRRLQLQGRWPTPCPAAPWRQMQTFSNDPMRWRAAASWPHSGGPLPAPRSGNTTGGDMKSEMVTEPKVELGKGPSPRQDSETYSPASGRPAPCIRPHPHRLGRPLAGRGRQGPRVSRTVCSLPDGDQAGSNECWWPLCMPGTGSGQYLQPDCWSYVPARLVKARWWPPTPDE